MPKHNIFRHSGEKVWQSFRQVHWNTLFFSSTHILFLDFLSHTISAHFLATNLAATLLQSGVTPLIFWQNELPYVHWLRDGGKILECKM